MQSIMAFVASALGKSNTDAMVSLFVNHLQSVGVETFQDIGLLQESDFDPLKNKGITIIQIRKVQRAYDERALSKKASDNPPTCEASTSSSTQRPGASCQASTSNIPRSVGVDEFANWASQFKVPLSKLSPNLREPLTKSTPLSVPLRRQFVRETVALVRNINRKPGRANLRIIASNLVRDYPSLVFVTYSGRKIAGGNSSLVGCLEAAVENASKKDKRTSRVNDEELEDNPAEVPVRQIFRKVDYYGCVEGMYCPNSLPQGETKESQENSRQVMLALRDEEGKLMDLNLALELISSTFISQRWELTKERPGEDEGDESSLIHSILERWPLLFDPSCANEHIKTLTGVNMIQNTRDFLSTEANDFFQFAIGNAPREVSWKLIKLTKELRDWEACGFCDRQIWTLLSILCIHFSEDINDIVRVEEPTKRPNEVDLLLLPATPMIIAFGPSALAAHRYMITVDKHIINEDITDAVHAFTLWFNMYFMMHLLYSDASAFTCEFVQRQIALIDPQEGSKRRKKKGRAGNAVSLAVISLMANYAEFKRNIN